MTNWRVLRLWPDRQVSCLKLYRTSKLCNFFCSSYKSYISGLRTDTHKTLVRSCERKKIEAGTAIHSCCHFVLPTSFRNYQVFRWVFPVVFFSLNKCCMFVSYTIPTVNFKSCLHFMPYTLKFSFLVVINNKRKTHAERRAVLFSSYCNITNCQESEVLTQRGSERLTWKRTLNIRQTHVIHFIRNRLHWSDLDCDVHNT